MTHNSSEQRPEEVPDSGVSSVKPQWSKRRELSPAIPIFAVFLVIALFAGLSSLSRSEPEETAAQETPTSSFDPVLPDLTVDSDGDGIPDVFEVSGWIGVDGNTYFTDSDNPDTDGDGLTDAEEAGELISSDEQEAVYSGVSDPTKADSDDDGLEDKTEVLGWKTLAGESFFTDPMNPDSDGDGLLDGDEAGERVDGGGSEEVYVGFSNPGLVDTDGDRLSDAEEADVGTDPYRSDTDGDGLSDYQEIMVVGTDPFRVDTDGDGLSDKHEVDNRDKEGLDPLFVDVPVSKWTYALDFAKGAALGEAAPSDSLAWLAGSLVSSGTGFIPVIGVIVGGLADIRDAIASAIRGDWVGVGFSALGLIPTVGDAAAIPKKVAAFVSRHPELAASVGALVVTLRGVPESIKIDTSRKIWKESWDPLLDAGATDRALLRLQKSGHMNLDAIGAAVKRGGHRAGSSSRFLRDGRVGEQAMTRMLASNGRTVENQVGASTIACVEVCNDSRRFFDAVVDGVAHESKVGQVSLTDFVRRQIMSDAYLVETGAIKGAHWHFYPSAATSQFGATKPLLDLLEEKGIPFTYHQPVVR